MCDKEGRTWQSGQMRDVAGQELSTTRIVEDLSALRWLQRVISQQADPKTDLRIC